MDYLSRIALVTFLTWRLVAYLTGQAKRATKENNDGISEALKELTEEILAQTLKERLPLLVGETQKWFWTVEWQGGEVEADLDKHLNRVQRFDSAHDLIQGLNKP